MNGTLEIHVTDFSGSEAEHRTFEPRRIARHARPARHLRGEVFHALATFHTAHRGFEPPSNYQLLGQPGIQ